MLVAVDMSKRRVGPAFATSVLLSHTRHRMALDSLSARRVPSVSARESCSSASRALVASATKDLGVASLQSRVAAVVAAGLLAFCPTVHIDSVHAPGPMQFGDFALAAKGGGDTFGSASGAVNKDSESLLRWSLPISNKPVRELQESLESAITDSRKLKWGKVEGDLRRAKGLLANKRDALMKAIPQDRVEEADSLIDSITDALPVLLGAADEKKIEKLVEIDRAILRDVGKLEGLMVTAFPFEVPAEYSNLPQLKGRATIEVVVRKAGDEPFDIDGTLYKEGEMTLVVDGYAAPISAGSFVDLASKGFYDGRPVIRSDGFIIQSGKPESGEGYKLKNGEVRTIPLEVFARGDKSPTYELTLEDDGRGTAATVLPFTSYGTLAMAREEFQPNTASSQYFWFLFEPDLTPAGRNLMDGSWATFGYTVSGQKFLRGLEQGDRIVSAKVVSGLENLINVSE